MAKNVKVKFNVIKRILKGQAVAYKIVVDTSGTLNSSIVASNVDDDLSVMITGCRLVEGWQWTPEWQQQLTNGRWRADEEWK
jgi:hypothetical protein